MATQALALVGTLAGGHFGGSIGAAIGGTLGGIGGSYIDQALGLGPPPIRNIGPRLEEVSVQSSAEGSHIDRPFGRVRVAGHIIWMSRFTEIVRTQSSGGGKGASPVPETSTTTYTYTCSVAVAVGHGPIVNISRFWADGRPIDLSDVTFRVYQGTEAQDADPLITSIEGANFTPAFKGIAYIVFEDLPLGPYGNRIPNFNFEVFGYATDAEDALEYDVRGVNILPGSGEFAYDPTVIESANIRIRDALNADLLTEVATWRLEETTDGGQQVNLGFDAQFKVVKPNNNTGSNDSDWTRAIDDLETQLPNCDTAQLVVSWFGNDLRLGNCVVEPRIEFNSSFARDITARWKVTGVEREDANAVSRSSITGESFENGSVQGDPVYGGTPTDHSVFEAITDLKARGLKVAFYPFILMDVNDVGILGNAENLPNPYSDNAATIGQPLFPWRGRITVSPAREYAGTVDKTAAAATQVNNFFGNAPVSAFGTWDGTTIPYTDAGTVNEFKYRRMILHYAKLCQQAGGVDIFYIGTEMVRMMQTRSAAGTFPAVDAMITLAADVRTILGSGTKIAYAADWSEWNGYDPGDGTGDFYHHLDPLYADSNIDLIAIDNYMPLSDWRDGLSHTDRDTYDNIYDLNYLKGNISSGELYDWFYASESDRQNQVRTDITDGTYSKPWVFRRKDLKNWWENNHYNRPGGVEDASATSWVPESKPIIFSELGCPAIDKGSNQPNVFVDPKSSESAFPYFSSGGRDDIIQRKFIEAHFDYWADSANNPMSSQYSGTMVDTTRIILWTWDARPFPYFPSLQSTWTDYGNWALGHWITGRFGVISLEDLVSRIMDLIDVTYDVSQLRGIVFGYNIDRSMSVADMLSPLMAMYFFDVYESEGVINFKHRASKPLWTITDDEFSLGDLRSESYLKERAEDTELPNEIEVRFLDIGSDMQIGAVYARRLVGGSVRRQTIEVAIASTPDLMQSVANLYLIEAHTHRESIEFELTDKYLAMDPSDSITLTAGEDTVDYRVMELNYSDGLSVSAVRTDETLYDNILTETAQPPVLIPATPSKPLAQVVELPFLNDNDANDFPVAPYFAAYTEPWYPIAYFRSATNSDFVSDSNQRIRSNIGALSEALEAGPEFEWDYGTTVRVYMVEGSSQLLTRDTDNVLNGANMGAIRCNNGEWEIIQWENAVSVATDVYDLTKLLRARFGTEEAMNSGAPQGAEFVTIDSLHKTQLPSSLRDILLYWKFGPVSRDITDDTFVTGTHTTIGIGLRPYSPVYLAIEESGSDDLKITWQYRSRFPDAGDEWDVVNSEEVEAYEIDIYDTDMTTVLRTLESTTTEVIYTSAQQVTDFGSNQTSVDVEIYQLSVTFGRGTGRRATLTV